MTSMLYLREFSWAHTLRSLSEDKVISLTKAEEQYARAAEEYLAASEEHRLPSQQMHIIFRLYSDHIAPLLRGEETTNV